MRRSLRGEPGRACNHGERAARLIPNATLEVIKDAGHVCFWDQPEVTNRLLAEFLNAE